MEPQLPVSNDAETIAALRAENERLRQHIALLEQNNDSAHQQQPAGYNQERCELFSRLIEMVPDAIAITDLDLTIIYANPAFHTLFGYDYNLVGAKGSMMWADEHQSLPEVFRHVLHAGAQTLLLTLQRQDGSLFTAELSVALICDSSDQPYAFAGVLRDVTGHMQTEVALHLSRTLLQGILDYSPATIIAKDIEGRILLVNRYAAASTNHVPEQMVGRTDDELLSTEEFLVWREHDQQVIAANKPLTFEEYVSMSDGIHTFLAVRFPLYDEQQQIYGVGCVSTDITEHKQQEKLLEQRIAERTTQLETANQALVSEVAERKRTEHELARAYANLEILNEHLAHNHKLLSAIFDGLQDGLVLLDSQIRVRMVNSALATLLDSSPDMLKDQPWTRIHASFVPVGPGHIAPHLTNHEASLSQRVSYAHRNGNTHILDIQTMVLRHTSQTEAQFIVHVVDVTRQVQLQARLIENERFAASGRLAASVAHEINTPLQALLLFLDLIPVANETERNDYLKHAQAEIQRVGRIVRQLLDLYRPDAETSGPVDIPALFERILLLNGKRIKDQGVVVQQNLAANLPTLQGQTDELTQVFLNLVMNALDAMPGGGTLTIDITVRGEAELVTAVNDTGGGIPSAIEKRIFEPFVTTKSSGSGLGLNISAQIVQQHGGSIDVYNHPGTGSTFEVILPLHPGKSVIEP